MTLTRHGATTAPDGQPCTGPLAPHVEGFAAQLSRKGYAQITVRAKCNVLADLSRWLERRRLTLAALDEDRLTQFLASLRHGEKKGEAIRPPVSSFSSICAAVTKSRQLHRRLIELRPPASRAISRSSSTPNEVCHGQH